MKQLLVDEFSTLDKVRQVSRVAAVRTAFANSPAEVFEADVYKRIGQLEKVLRRITKYVELDLEIASATVSKQKELGINS